jgi:class 3 adenylate cyclase/TolB-like protein/cytochrome c-type biogenesis protein CcmH/NrfG
MERRLVAILVADVVGYGRLIEQAEEATLRRLQGELHDLVLPKIAEHHGRPFKTTGDGLLAEFHSVVDAVRCALEVQKGEYERNGGLPENQRIAFRIGINLGDVVEEDGDLYGEGVIIASRLEGLAKPGGVMISGTAYDHVKKRIEVGYESLGEINLKSIAEPVRVYRLLTDAEVIGSTTDTARMLRSWRWYAAAAGMILLTIGVAAVLRSHNIPDLLGRDPVQSITACSYTRVVPEPNRVSIAVVQFNDLTGDPQQGVIARGIADDLNTALSRIHGLFVIASNSSFRYRPPVDICQMAKDLGVTHVVEGSVQGAGDMLRINVQLIETATLGHVWAETFDGTFSGVFMLQTKVAVGISDALAMTLTDQERNALVQNETSVPAAYKAFLRGWAHYRRSTPDDYAKAIPYFEEAIRLDPEYGRAYAALAAVYFQSQDFYWTVSLGLSRGEAYDRAERYLQQAQHRPPTSTTYYIAANVARGAGRYSEAITAFKEAIAFDPSDSWSYAQLGLTLSLVGRQEEATSYINTAMRLDPHYPPQFLYFLGATQLLMNQLTEAAANLERATRLNPDQEWSFLLLAATYGYLGRKEEAASAVARYNELAVKRGGIPLWIMELKRRTRSLDFISKRLFEGLRLAGVPESLPETEFAQNNRLSDEELHDLLFGHRLRGRTPITAREWGVAITLEGVVTLSGEWVSSNKSVARFEHHQVCFTWGYRETERCAAIFRNPGGLKANGNEYIWYDDLGAFPFSLVE